MANKLKRYFIDSSAELGQAQERNDESLLESSSQTASNVVQDVEQDVVQQDSKIEEKKKQFKRKKRHSKTEDPDESVEKTDEIDPEKLKKYKKKPLKIGGLATNFQKKKFLNRRKKYEFSVKQAARTELLLPEDAGYIEAEEGEKSYAISQKEIVHSVDITSASKHFELDLKKFGPYRMDYTKNGRHLLLGGKLGHVAAIDWLTKDLLCEINVMESVRDVHWLHNQLMFAVAQKRYTYIYDHQGVELHCLKMLHNTLRLEFLPYHFLLVGATSASFLNWVDVSIGKLVASFPTKVGPLDIMCQNPRNAIVHCGQSRGIVSLWSPNVNEPLVKLKCHVGPVRGLAIDQSGIYMATTGCDKSLKIWDIRKFQPLFDYKLNRSSEPIAFSQRRTLACALGSDIQIFKDVCTKPVVEPYLSHKVNEMITDLQFCPYEDVLGVGHRAGFTSLLVPGAGEPNLDAYEANPYGSKRHRQEAEVRGLLDKIQPEMITLDEELICRVDAEAVDSELKDKLELMYKKAPQTNVKLKHKAKGKSSGVSSFRRKQLIKEDRKQETLKDRERVKKGLIQDGILDDSSETKPNRPKDVLDRFRRKPT